MKLLLVLIPVVIFISCRKSPSDTPVNKSTSSALRESLRDSLSIEDFSQLDFSRFFVSKLNNTTIYRIGLRGKKLSQQFLLIKANEKEGISRGFIIELHRDDVTEKNRFSYNGSINISSLNRKEIRTSKIVNGYITSFHSALAVQRTMVVPSKAHVLPDVVVTTYIPSTQYVYPDNTSISYLSFFQIASGGGTSGSYNSLNGEVASPSGSGGSGDPGSGGIRQMPNDTNTGMPLDEPKEENSIVVDFEFAEDLSAINVDDYLKCFKNVPDNGAKCTIEIFTDIPEDKDPNRLFNWMTGSPGHCFLQLKKENGSNSVMQNIGFYPRDGWKIMLTPAPVSGKLVDNGQHEFNASLKMDITPDQLKTTLTHIEYLSKFIKYDIDNYNCTDFALEVFNQSRPANPIEIPRYDLPGGMTPSGSNTPQGLYNKLKSMQQLGVESANINIPGLKGYVASSDGPCN